MTMEQLASATEVDLGTSRWRVITQDMVDRFAEATGDYQWIHVDPEGAAQGPFGTTVAHGYLTLALLPALLGELLQVTDARMAVNYGLDRLRLTAPVRVGAAVRARAVLRSAQEKAGGLLLRLDVTVEIQDEVRPALIAQMLSLRYP